MKRTFDDEQSIYSATGKMIEASKQCLAQRHPGGMRSKPTCKLYNDAGQYINEFSCVSKNWVVCLKAAMHTMENGVVEFVCGKTKRRRPVFSIR